MSRLSKDFGSDPPYFSCLGGTILGRGGRSECTLVASYIALSGRSFTVIAPRTCSENFIFPPKVLGAPENPSLWGPNRELSSTKVLGRSVFTPFRPRTSSCSRFSEREPPHRELHFAVILVIRNHFSHSALIVRTFCYPTLQLVLLLQHRCDSTATTYNNQSRTGGPCMIMFIAKKNDQNRHNTTDCDIVVTNERDRVLAVITMLPEVTPKELSCSSWFDRVRKVLRRREIRLKQRQNGKFSEPLR